MLQSLALRDFVIVDHLELDLSEGFTVLTGETGAGKSILLDALGLALGERADSSQIRETCSRAEITAIFHIDDLQKKVIADWLENQGLTPEDDGSTLLLKRIIESNGRSRAFINGSAASLNQLRDAGNRLVDIHGQHAHQLLLKSGAQRDLLDRHAGLSPQVEEVNQAFKRLSESRRRLMQAENAGKDIQREQERIQWQLEELDQLAPLPDEWALIQIDHARLANAAKLIGGCQTTLDLLSESETSIHSTLSQLASEMSALAKHDQSLQTVADDIHTAEIQIEELIHSLNRYLQKLDLDPDRLGEIEARMQALHSSARKYKVRPEELNLLWEDTKDQLKAIQAAENIDALREQVDQSEVAYLKEAQSLSKKRQQAAEKLENEVTAAMQNLSMKGGQLKIALNPLAEGGSYGLEQIEFLIAAHSGSTPRPLAKVASGGELARISLAISVITSKASFTPTLIFDEVDAGIGGAVAETVGKLLAQLGQSHQILCVTHLPQVASQGNHHFKVSKIDKERKTISQVLPLSRADRVEEIARMLGGATITDTTRRHARELLGSN
ncbi:MAG: DNA repair protein RecN [Polynucleobacter sp.]|jgi:DNA repair protein RecN (Recombination protein N)|nr:DNA repair protein RecN [Polynucleobacter sp.]